MNTKTVVRKELEKYLARVNKKLFANLRRSDILYDNKTRLHDPRRRNIPHLRDSWVKPRMTTRGYRQGFYLTKKNAIKFRVDNTSIPFNVWMNSENKFIKPKKEGGKLKFFWVDKFYRRDSVYLDAEKYRGMIEQIVRRAAEDAVEDVGKYTVVLNERANMRGISYAAKRVERQK